MEIKQAVLARAVCPIARLASKILILLATVLAFLSPRVALAQIPLQNQWVYRSISQAKAVAYSPDGTLLAVGGVAGIQIFSGSTGLILQGFPTSATYAVNSLAFSPDGKTLAIGGQSGTTQSSFGVLELRSVSTGALTALLNTSATSAVESVAFSPSGTTLAAGGIGAAAVLELWNVVDGKLIASLGTSAAGGVAAVAFSPSGTALADGGIYGGLELWDVATHKKSASLKSNLSQRLDCEVHGYK